MKHEEPKTPKHTRRPLPPLGMPEPALSGWSSRLWHRESGSPGWVWAASQLARWSWGSGSSGGSVVTGQSSWEDSSTETQGDTEGPLEFLDNLLSVQQVRTVSRAREGFYHRSSQKARINSYALRTSRASEHLKAHIMVLCWNQSWTQLLVRICLTKLMRKIQDDQALPSHIVLPNNKA